MINTVFFDVGNTLIDAEDIFLRFARELDKPKLAHGIKKEFYAYYSKDEFLCVSNIYQKILMNMNSDLSAHSIYYNHFVNHSNLKEGCNDTLERLKERTVKMHIVSDADRDVLIPQLEKFKIKRYFNTFFISSDMKAYKPSNKVVKIIKESIEFKTDNALFMGDSKVDYETAQQLGVRFVLIGKSINYNPRISGLKELLNLISI